MNKNGNNEDQQLLIKQFIQDYMKDYTERLTNDYREKDDHSFIFLEGNTLYLLLTYMLNHLENKGENGNKEEFQLIDLEDISSTIDSMIMESKETFEEILDDLRGKV
ncbi:hypothetical protein [Oceanobacillus senegalensis]|uniref:hypothetical protein n=1 Tax=Oceanobacillus senegalensis TaxID=1936063 RepID=UPI000A30D41D|nr:hypothetical protein [Oceanobacillus senegalensis]